MTLYLHPIDVNVNVSYRRGMMSADIRHSSHSARVPSWGVREFASLFDITPRAVRFYEDKGLLSPARQAGSRVFCPAEHARMVRILRAKRLGFSLDDIKAVLDVTDGLVTDHSELMTRQANFKKVIASLRRRRSDIDILTQEMTELCNSIEKFVSENPQNSGAFKYAEAYDAVLRQHMDDDFAPDSAANEGQRKPSAVKTHKPMNANSMNSKSMTKG